MAKAIGTSNTGNLQEAINEAISDALHSTSGADMLIKWKLESVTGEEGGIAGVKKLTVAISYDE